MTDPTGTCKCSICEDEVPSSSDKTDSLCRLTKSQYLLFERVVGLPRGQFKNELTNGPYCRKCFNSINEVLHSMATIGMIQESLKEILKQLSEKMNRTSSKEWIEIRQTICHNVAQNNLVLTAPSSPPNNGNESPKMECKVLHEILRDMDPKNYSDPEAKEDEIIVREINGKGAKNKAKVKTHAMKLRSHSEEKQETEGSNNEYDKQFPAGVECKSRVSKKRGIERARQEDKQVDNELLSSGNEKNHSIADDESKEAAGKPVEQIKSFNKPAENFLLPPIKLQTITDLEAVNLVVSGERNEKFSEDSQSEAELGEHSKIDFTKRRLICSAVGTHDPEINRIPVRATVIVSTKDYTGHKIDQNLSVPKTQHTSQSSCGVQPELACKIEGDDAYNANAERKTSSTEHYLKNAKAPKIPKLMKIPPPVKPHPFLLRGMRLSEYERRNVQLKDHPYSQPRYLPNDRQHIDDWRQNSGYYTASKWNPRYGLPQHHTYRFDPYWPEQMGHSRQDRYFEENQPRRHENRRLY